MELFQILQYGIFDTELNFPGKKRSEDRVLNLYQIEYFYSATGTAYINGKAYPLERGCLLCAKSGQVRRSDFGFRCGYVHLTFPPDSPLEKKLRDTPDYFRFLDPSVYAPIFERLSVLSLEEEGNPPSELVTAKVLELLYYINKDAELNRSFSALPQGAATTLLPRITEYIRTEYMNPLSLKDMAQKAGYSPHYFHKIFTSVMHITPLEYLLSVRIQKAKETLIRSDKALAQIAYDCGFSSQSYFNLQFKKKTGITPGEFRKQHFSHYEI